MRAFVADLYDRPLLRAHHPYLLLGGSPQEHPGIGHIAVAKDALGRGQGQLFDELNPKASYRQSAQKRSLKNTRCMDCFWPIATFRGIETIRPLSERSGHSATCAYRSNFTSTRPSFRQ
jgi:hypothetical protein